MKPTAMPMSIRPKVEGVKTRYKPETKALSISSMDVPCA
jgi:hypothetical protein